MARIRSLMWLVPVVVLSACTSFDNRWNTTPAPMTANPAAIMAGKWEGTWQSDATDYHGHLQSIIELKELSVEDKQPVQQYEAHFLMRLFEAPAREYTVVLSAAKLPDGRIHFEGAKDLGFYAGGIYRYDGFIYPEQDEFYCDYSSDKDTGTFKMRRITQEIGGK